MNTPITPLFSKQVCLLAGLMFSLFSVSAQVGINSTNQDPHPSAMLDVQSANKGLLTPRMDSTSRKAILNPAEGLMVYDSTTHSFWYFQASTWQELSNTNSSIKNLVDTDGDTQIQVEASPDEDILRFDAAGKELLQLSEVGLLASGTFQSNYLGAIPDSGAGTRLMWVPQKSAFRAGTVDGDQWDRDSMGVHSSVAGGLNNIASGPSSFVGGGMNNKASAPISFVGGGLDNLASDLSSTIGGGLNNASTAPYSTVGGGTSNLASGQGAVVAGGDENISSGENAAIGGGEDNEASGDVAFVGGGNNNSASAYGAFVGGGNGNQISGLNSFVGGGSANTASDSHAVVVGGSGNTASGGFSIIGGGTDNDASGTLAFVGGGSINLSSGSHAAVVGGTNNTASGNFAFVGGEQIIPLLLLERSYWGCMQRPIRLRAQVPSIRMIVC